MSIVDVLHRFLYPGQFEIIPGEFESFLTGVTEISDPVVAAVRPARSSARR